MDNEMIERMAKAAYDKRTELQNMPLQACYVSIVKAIIIEMREPTEKMLSIDAPDMPAGGDVKEIWQAMIDAVIND